MSDDFTELIDLASERLGGAVIYANDEFFAPKENLLKAAEPVFIEGKYTERGKWMDGWESRRRRTPGFDWCLIRLGLPGRARGLVVDTSYFRGNYPESCSVEVCAIASTPDPEQLAADSVGWKELLPLSPLRGDSKNLFEVPQSERCTHLRLKIYPDGGVARLRVHGEAAPDWPRLLSEGGLVDLAAADNGGLVIATSDEFFGRRNNLIMPGRGLDMGDGWETKRRRGPGYDWAVVRLGAPGTPRRVEVDTNHFKGNFPESFSLELCRADRTTAAAAVSSLDWREVLPRTRLQAHTRHFYDVEPGEAFEATHARFNIYPDGGVSRLRLYGTITSEGVAGL